MKRVLVTLFATVLVAFSAWSQHKQLLYDFYEIPQSLLLNPGVKTAFKWHAGLPVVSGNSFQVGSSGITVNDLFANDGIDFTTKVRERAINGLSIRDEFGGSGQIELLTVGFRGRNRPNDYYSFGMYGEGFGSVFWPRDLAILAFEGNANNLNRPFDLGHLVAQGEAVNVFHFGVNRNLNNGWIVGLRGKIYSSIFDFRSINNSGFFVTRPGQNNILDNTLIADLELKTSGLDTFYDILQDDTAENQELANAFVSRALFGGDLGLGFDVGFTYDLTESTTITGSLIDVGFIYYSTDVRNRTIRGAVSNEGIEFFLPEALFQGATDIWQNLVDDIEMLVPLEDNENSYFAIRPIKLNASIRHNFGNPENKIRARSGFDHCDCTGTAKASNTNPLAYRNAVGGYLSVINRARGPQAALSAFYQRRFGNILALKATYAIDKYSLSNVGLGLNLQAGPVNFYVLADNLLGYQNIADSHYASFQFGLNIISWNGN